jgi:FAD:protein FMN transferase
MLACNAPARQRFDSEFLAMGTRVQLSVLAENPAEAAALSAHVERNLLREGVDWYPWTRDASGELRQINAALAKGEIRNISPSLAALLRRAMQAFDSSEGYFDPAVKPMTEVWGFADEEAPPRQPPNPTVLAHWRESRPTMGDLHLEGQRISSLRHDLQLDLGAIAKGYAEQLALQQLRELGCTDAAINLGGQLATIGTAMANRLAAVAIRDPRADQALATLQLKAGESVATSGDYERFVERNGKRSHHLLDPHTGQPVTHTQAVTVVSSDPTLADAAATALMAAGSENWQRIARQLGIREALRVDATGAIEVTAALYARLQWLPASQTRRIRQIII